MTQPDQIVRFSAPLRSSCTGVSRGTPVRGGYREGNDVTARGNDAPVDAQARQESSADSPANHSDHENVPEGNASSDDSQKSPAEQAVENQERALKTGEELPG